MEKKTNWVGAVYINTISSLKTTNSTAYDAVARKTAFQIANGAVTSLTLTVQGVPVFENGGTYGWSETLTGNNTVDVAALKTSLATTRATELGVTLDVAATGEPTHKAIKFLSGIRSATGDNGENYTNTEVAALKKLLNDTDGYMRTTLTSYDKFTISYGDGVSATVTLTATQVGASGYVTGIAAATTLAAAVHAKWDELYSTGQGSAAYSFWSAASAPTSHTIAAPSLKSSLSGSRAYNDALTFTWNAAAATSAAVSAASSGAVTETILDWVIGATEATTDNKSIGNALIISVKEDVAGSSHAVPGGDTTSSGVTLFVDSGAVTQVTFELLQSLAARLTTTLISNGDSATDTDTTYRGIYHADARGDVVNNEAANEGLSVTTGVARVTFSRIHWLSS